MKKKKRLKERLRFFSFLLILLIAILIIFSYSYLSSRMKKILSTQGFIRMRVSKLATSENLSAIQLSGDCSQLTFYISPQQAYSISQGLSGKRSFRPLTHDTLVNILESFGIKPIQVKITQLKENTYYAKVYLQKWNHLLILDSRPSDAIAIAVRTKTPIYVNSSLVEKVC